MADVDDPELLGVRVGQLDIEELVSLSLEVGDQGGEADFGGVRPAELWQAEHGLGKEGCVNRDAVDAADEGAAAVGLDGVGKAEVVEPGVGSDHLGTDPGLVTRASGPGAVLHDLGECRIRADLKDVSSQEFAKRTGTVEGIEREDGTGITAIEVVRAGVGVGHHERAEAIGTEEVVRGEGVDSAFVFVWGVGHLAYRARRLVCWAGSGVGASGPHAVSHLFAGCFGDLHNCTVANARRTTIVVGFLAIGPFGGA